MRAARGDVARPLQRRTRRGDAAGGHIMKTFIQVALALALSAATGCARCAPDTVGAGVARLTIKNIGAVARLVEHDALCGFASPSVRSAPDVRGEIGGPGSITTSVTACAIDLGAGYDLDVDCAGVVTRARGKVIVTATRMITGELTGDAEHPILPASADAVVLSISDATFDDFEVTTSGSSDSLRILEGSLQAIVAPRLAVSASTGACAVPTPNVQFSSVQYGPSRVRVATADGDVDVDVARSALTAQSGRGGAGENTITGTITVFGEEVDAEDDGALDPAYDAAAFTAAYACLDDLAAPDAFTCADLTRPLADGAARLSVKMLAAITRLVEADASCGFSSSSAQASATSSGPVGAAGAISFRVVSCSISVPAPIELAVDCLGHGTTFVGDVRVTGTKTIAGRLTGNPLRPVVPTTSTPASYALSVEMLDARVGSTADARALAAPRGTLTGSVVPRTALSADDGACTVPTPHARVTLSWEDATLVVTSELGTGALTVDRADLMAVAGTVGVQSNALSGTVTVGGEALIVPSDGAGLDPAYDPALFEAAWQCAPTLHQPVSFACNAVEDRLAASAAALTMRTFATVAALVDKDAACGFASLPVGVGVTFTDGAVGDDGATATFDLGAGCTVSLPADTVVAIDCAGNTTTAGGAVTVTGTKRVVGYRTGDPRTPVVPTSRDAARFDLALSFDGAELAVGTSASTSRLIVHSGALTGTLAPRTALDPTTGACTVATPNASFSDVRWSDAEVTLAADGDRYALHVVDSDLAAVNGTIDGAQNVLTGDLRTDDGLAANIALPLDPAFDQGALDASFACAGVQVPTDAACSFRGVLGNAAARLLVKAVATAASVIDGNAMCGFAAPAVQGAALQTGASGGPGALTLQVEAGCMSGFAADTAIAVDCAGTVTHASGAVVVDGSARRTVTGFLTGSPSAPIFPVSPTAVTATLTDLRMIGWTIFDARVDGVVASRATIDGTAQLVLRPIAGASVSASAAASAATGGAISTVYSHRTPVASLRGITLHDAAATLVLDGKTFRVAIDDAVIDAFAGAWIGDSTVPAFANTIGGSITVDGQAVALVPTLVTGYDQSAFDATYFDVDGGCAADLLAPIPAG